jgi:hypothetical protein
MRTIGGVVQLRMLESTSLQDNRDTHLRTIVRRLQHDRAVAELRDQIVFTLNGFTDG